MLNILPTNRKQALRRHSIMQQIRFLVSIAVVATSISVVMLFASDWLLQRWLKDITVETKSDIISTDERSALQLIVSDIVKLVNQAEPIITQQPQPLYDVTIILGPTPTDIKLHEYQIDYTEHELSLTGTADTRDALVAYQQIVRDI